MKQVDPLRCCSPGSQSTLEALWYSPNLVLKTAESQKAMPRQGGRYRVATVQDRVIYLITLDLGRQQQLLAVAGALVRQE